MDITLAGIISGMAGSAVCLVLGLILRWIGWTNRTFDNLAQVFILSRECPGALAFFMGSVVHLGIGGALGVIFAYFIKATSPNYMITKGIFFGAMVFVSFVGLGNYYRMDLFTNMTPLASFLLWVASMIYGLTMSLTLKKLSPQLIKE